MPSPRAVSVVEQRPDGAVFAMSDGSTQYLTGQGATDLATRLPGASAPPPSAPPVPQAPPPALPRAGGATGTWEAGVAGAPPAPPAPAQQPPATPGEQPLPSQLMRQQLIDQLGRGTWSPGRDPEREKRTGVMVPKGGKVTTEGGMDPDFARRVQGERDRLYAADTAAQVADAEARVAMVDEARVQARENAARLAVSQREQEARLVRMQQSHDEHLSRLEGDLDAAYSRKVQPTALFSSGSWAGAVGQIGLSIAMAFEARGGGRPLTWESVQRIIERDVAKQEAEINRGIDRGKNALSRYLVRFDGDMTTAKAALAATQEGLAKSYAQDLAARTQRLDIQRGLNDWIGKTGNARLDALVKFNEAVQGKVTREVAQEFAVPKAAGYQGPSVANLEKRVENQERLESGGTAGYEGQLAQAKAFGTAGGTAAGRGAAGALSPEDEQRFKAYSETEGQHQATQSDLDELTKLLGGKRKGDAISWDRSKNIPGVGPIGGKVPGFLTGEEGRRTRRVLTEFLQSYIATTNKGPASDADVARIDRAIRGYGTETEIQDAVTSMQRKLNVSRRAARAAAGPSVVSSYRRSNAQTTAGYEQEMAGQAEDTEGLELETGEKEK